LFNWAGNLFVTEVSKPVLGRDELQLGTILVPCEEISILFFLVL